MKNVRYTPFYPIEKYTQTKKYYNGVESSFIPKHTHTHMYSTYIQEHEQTQVLSSCGHGTRGGGGGWGE